MEDVDVCRSSNTHNNMICLSCHGPNDLTLGYGSRESSLVIEGDTISVKGDTIIAKLGLTLQKAKLPKDNLSKVEKASLKNLRGDDVIMILLADKGRATVILNKEDYIRKCNDHDNGHYQYLKKA